MIRARSLLAADHRRTRAIERLNKTMGMAAAYEESERLCDLLVNAEDAVCAYPRFRLIGPAADVIGIQP